MILCGHLALHIPPKVFAAGLRKAWFLVVLTFMLHLLVSGRGAVNFADILNLNSAHFDVAEATLFTFRLVLILSVGISLAYVYSSAELARVVARSFARLPFGRKLMAQLELLIMLALQFVPFLEQENQRLEFALTARGQSFGHGTLARIRAWRKIMFPLLVNTFRRADHVSLAIQARGFDPEIRRTSLNARPVPLGQWVITTLFVAMCLVVPWI